MLLSVTQQIANAVGGPSTSSWQNVARRPAIKRCRFRAQQSAISGLWSSRATMRHRS